MNGPWERMILQWTLKCSSWYWYWGRGRGFLTVWLFDPSSGCRIRRCLDPIRHPLDIQFHVHRYIVSLWFWSIFSKYLKENTWSNSLLCNSPRSLVLSCLSRRLKKEKDSIVDFLRIWWMYEWNMKAKPEKTCCEAAGRWIVDSGRLEWQHRHYRGHYQCTGVSGQDYHHRTLGYHYHS